MDFGPSNEIFGDMKLESIFGPMGRNYGVGWYDDFLSFPATTLYNGYIIVATNGSIAMIPSTGNSATTALGIASLNTNSTANDECVLQLGNGLDVGAFKISDKDLGFEARMSASLITANKLSWFVGLAMGGAAGAGITDKLFDDTTGAVYGTTNLIGFQKLYAETSAVDGMYIATGQTKQDGATKTKLDSLHTVVASTYFKLGFRYRAASNTLHWYVNGVENKAAKLTSAEIEAATFPDDVFLTPTIGLKDVAGDAAIILNLDWWLTAQSLV